MVEKIVGQLQDTNILSQDPKAIALKLQMLYDSLIKEAGQADVKANTTAGNLRRAGRGVRTLIPQTIKTNKIEERVRIKIQ